MVYVDISIVIGIRIIVIFRERIFYKGFIKKMDLVFGILLKFFMK